VSTDLDVVIAAVVAAGVPRVYKPNGVPTSPQMPYTVVTVTRETPGNYALTGEHGTWPRRATLQSFDTDADGALDFDRLATDALQDQIPAFTGLVCTPWRVQVGSALVRDPDNQGVVGVTTTLLCTTST
jgi:hypothetical protein